jgi:hypothetical protein
MADRAQAHRVYIRPSFQVINGGYQVLSKLEESYGAIVAAGTVTTGVVQKNREPYIMQQAGDRQHLSRVS